MCVFASVDCGPMQQSLSASGSQYLQTENLIMVFISLIMVIAFISLVPPHLTLLYMQNFFPAYFLWKISWPHPCLRLLPVHVYAKTITDIMSKMWYLFYSLMSHCVGSVIANTCISMKGISLPLSETTVKISFTFFTFFHWLFVFILPVVLSFGGFIVRSFDLSHQCGSAEWGPGCALPVSWGWKLQSPACPRSHQESQRRVSLRKVWSSISQKGRT